VKVGDLVRVLEDPQWGFLKSQLGLIIYKTKTKKRWHRKITLLMQDGYKVQIREDCGIALEVISECEKCK